ncbi:MAG: response regulator, partial [Pseudomonadota bacterium]
PGKGTGLGLSMVYGFVRQVGGFMRLYSEPGRGTTVSLFFREADETHGFGSAAGPDSGLTPSRETAEYRAQGRVLVVEDQAEVRDVAVSLLQEFGFTTQTAESADAALALLEADPSFDLVFTDIVMPGELDGVSLAKEAGRRWPDLPFVFATGYAEAALLRSGDVSSAHNLVNKPYRRETLADTISDVLGRSTQKHEHDRTKENAA